jgi:hypothetical protein
MAHPKVPAPREYEFNEADRAAFRTRFWRCPVRLVEDGTWAALWTAGGRRKRGGGAAGALLPVLTLHAWPEQDGAVPGWTGTASLPYRRLARLAGLDKDTVTTALEDLAALELVRMEVERIAQGDVRRRALVRVAVRAFAADGERHVRFPGGFVYGGGWSRLPGAAERHLCVAWTAWARAQMTDPDAGPLPRELGLLRERLGPVSGMGATAVRNAVAALVAWRTPAGAGMVQDRGGFLRPDLEGEAALYEWPLANTALLPLQSPEPTAAEPRTADRPVGESGMENSAAPACDRSGASAAAIRPAERVGVVDAEESAPGGVGGAGSRAVRPRRGGGRRASESGDVAALSPRLPPLEGQDAFEARKAWLVRRYLARWVARVLRRGWQPARVAVFVDLCPGPAAGGRPSGLRSALEVAQHLRLKTRRGAPAPLEVVAVEPDPERARELRSAFRFYVHSRLLTVTQMPPGECVTRFGPQQAVLVFLGAVEDEVLTIPEIQLAFTKPDRELVALSRGGLPDPPIGHLWRSVRGNAQEEQGAVARLARYATRAGASTVLSTPLFARTGAPAGLAVHAATDISALLHWKAALSPRGSARQEPAQTEFKGRSGQEVQAVAEMMAYAFAGRQVPWSHADWRLAPLRRYALRASALLPGELLGLRRELTARGWRELHRPLAYRFPKPENAGRLIRAVRARSAHDPL